MNARTPPEIPTDKPKLPVAYGKSRLVLLPVDPYLIHAYWEVTPEKLDEAKDQAGGAQAVLRFYKVVKTAGENAPTEWFDVEIDVQSPNWYVHLWSADESYYADLALKRNDGTLIPLARSPVVRMPRTQPPIALDERFMKVESTERRAEIIPPPVGHYEPQEAKSSLSNELKIWQPPPRPIDSEGIVRETLTKMYASRQWRPEPLEPTMEKFSPPSETTPVDLTEAAERRLSAGISSVTLQRDRLESRQKE